MTAPANKPTEANSLEEKRKRGIRYHSVLAPHEDFIRKARKGGARYKDLAERMAEEKGVRISAAGISAFVRRCAQGRGRAAEIPEPGAQTAPFPFVKLFWTLYGSSIEPKAILEILAKAIPLLEGGMPAASGNGTPTGPDKQVTEEQSPSDRNEGRVPTVLKNLDKVPGRERKTAPAHASGEQQIIEDTKKTF